MYEKTVDHWKKQKHNSRNIEATYSERTSITDFLRKYEAVNGKLTAINQVNCKFDHNQIQRRPFFLNEGSMATAEKIICELDTVKMTIL